MLTNLTYTGANQPMSWLWASGSVYQRSYDALNRVTNFRHASGVPSVFEYDGGATPVAASIGKLTRITDESVVYH